MFKKAMLRGDNLMLTENGMETYQSSTNPVLDMFFKMSGYRGSTEVALGLFNDAYEYDRQLSLRCLFHLRNVRGGQGERVLFRESFRYLANKLQPKVAIKMLKFIPEFGRWDDVWASTFETLIEREAFDFMWEAVISGDALAAKWMPREGKKNDKVAKAFMRHLGISPREYRRIISSNTNVVETKMCENAWVDINYLAVPSKAMSIYDDAFYRHDERGFLDYLKTGKVNAGAIFPSDVIKPFFKGKNNPIKNLRIERQWSALPNYVPKGRRLLPISDVSGSMDGVPMEVSIALGMYVAERNIGPFQDLLITFSEEPAFLDISKGETLYDKFQIVRDADWGANTNLLAVFDLILSRAKSWNVKPEEMPTHIFIISDMQFDKACPDGGRVLTYMERLYSQAGYIRPNIIFWNVRSSYGVPAKEDDRGVALVSGFSPSAIRAVFDIEINEKGEQVEMTPMSVMLNTLNSEMYSKIVV